MDEWAGLRSVAGGYWHVSVFLFVLLPFWILEVTWRNAADTVYMYMHQQYLRTHTHQWSHQYCCDPQGTQSTGEAFICRVCECPCS